MPDGPKRVVILYSHPLLGEGIARLLGDGHDLEVHLVEVNDLEAAESALSGGPDVVILERSSPLQALELLRIAPAALLIDVGLDAGPSWAYHRDELSPRPDEILRAIRERRRPPESNGAPAEEPCGSPVRVASRGRKTVPAGPTAH